METKEFLDSYYLRGKVNPKCPTTPKALTKCQVFSHTDIEILAFEVHKKADNTLI